MRPIQMVDLRSQYLRLKAGIDQAIQGVLLSTEFINGSETKAFEKELSDYTGSAFTIGCANGTDALQLALLALDLPPGAEVITPSFSYAALAEMILLCGYKPVFVEVNPRTFTMDPAALVAAITPATKVIAPVHLYGQCADMESILHIASKFNLYVIEDTAQAIGARYTFSNGTVKTAGTMGHIGTTSFFPSKNLGCYGDGGAVFTQEETLARKLRMLANHGQRVKYTHEIVGMNSRLDSLQAAILRVKLQNLDAFTKARNEVADAYDEAFSHVEGVLVPARQVGSSHVFHQYTLTFGSAEIRNDVKDALSANGIPSMIYYPVPLHRQEAYRQEVSMPLTEDLTERVLSLPIHTEMDAEQIGFIVSTLKQSIEQTIKQ
ncbi:MAG: DegT/DnrJ/EryC1/StrS family aminotransferase [Bacteroidetes bacterium]|nr:DegT/DnrJ/EryC1/StrS family aminotransferase [Bacteroidota bacterium]